MLKVSLRSDGLRLGVSLGGGGVFFVAWHVSYLHQMGEQGIDLAGADRVVGTSAGALVAALLEAGRLGRFHRELTVMARAQKLLAALAPTDDGTEPGEPIVAPGHLQRVIDAGRLGFC